MPMNGKKKVPAKATKSNKQPRKKGPAKATKSNKQPMPPALLARFKKMKKGN